MEEETQDAQERHRDLEWYAGVLRRRHMPFLIALFGGWLAVWAASWVLPRTYKSTTLILVEEPTMPKNYVEPNVNENLQDRLNSISQQILSRTRLIRIIEKFHLYENRKGLRTIDDKIAMMRKDIEIELVRDHQTNDISAFRIYYSARDPYTAQRITSELTDLFIRENLESRQQESEDTTKFLQDQLASARVSLAAQEAKVRQFQAEHEGELPTQQTSNLQILSGLQSQLQNEQDALNTAQQQRVYYQAMIDQYRGLSSGLGVLDGSGDLSPLAKADQDLDKLKARLADLRSRYTERHPDVQAVEDQIATAERDRQKLIADEKAAVAGSRQDNGTGATTRVETPKSAAVLQLQSQLESNRLEIANRQKTITSLTAKISEYQARLNAEPATEQQLADLTRGYEQSKSNYDDLLKKESDSRMATSMERMQQGERFSMLDPPSLPTKPDFPNQLKFCGMGVGAGLGLGILVLVALEYFDDRIQSEKEIRDLLPVTTVCEISDVKDDIELKRDKMRLALGWTTGAVVFAVIAAAAVYSFLRV
jgi:succinoglycan biosynthesis transport protein ExoP